MSGNREAVRIAVLMRRRRRIGERKGPTGTAAAVTRRKTRMGLVRAMLQNI